MAERVKIINGADELVRGAEIKVYQPFLDKTKILKRPLQDLVPFEIKDSKHDGIKIDNNIGSNSRLTRPKTSTTSPIYILRC